MANGGLVSPDFGWPPLHIRAELDGNLWFTQGGKPRRSISITGDITEYSLPSAGTFRTT
jgi:hypothetical protein